MKPQTDMKNRNQKALLTLLITKQADTRIDLAAKSGLTKMTVTNFVNEWISNGLLVEEKSKSSVGRGRPKVSLIFGPKSPKVIGLLLQDDGFVLSLSSLDGTVIDTWNGKGKDPSIVEAIDQSINELLSKYINTNFLLVGVSSINSSFPKQLIDQLEKKLSLPLVYIPYEKAVLSNELLYGELGFGADALLVDLGDEIRCSLSKNGNLNQEPINLAHVSIDYNGLTCSCGKKGCLDAYISKRVMEKKLRDISKLKLDFAGFCQMQNKKNDNRVDWAMKDMMEKLGHGISNVLTILNVKTVLLSGEGTYIPDRYIAKLEKDLISEMNDRAIKVKKASLMKSDELKLPAAGAIMAYLAN